MRALWKDFDPATLATPEAFAADPERVTRWYDWRRIGCLAAEPNAAHLALARLERHCAARGGRFTLLTQNVDGLHQRAGSRNVVELHGTIVVWRCTHTGREVTPGSGPMSEYPARSPFKEGALLRPGVVWFGEVLPRGAVEAAEGALEECDCFMSVGTSSVVYPAAGFVEVAKGNGAYCIEVNTEATPATRTMDAALKGPAGRVMAELVGAVAGASG
jgi:NAD-dependent deacetylase